MIDGLFNSIIICIDRPFDMVSAPPFQMVYKGGRSSTNFEKGGPGIKGDLVLRGD